MVQSSVVAAAGNTDRVIMIGLTILGHAHRFVHMALLLFWLLIIIVIILVSSATLFCTHHGFFWGIINFSFLF